MRYSAIKRIVDSRFREGTSSGGADLAKKSAMP